MFNPSTERVICSYGTIQKLYHEILDVTFVTWLLSGYQKYLGYHSLIILDDLMAEVLNEEKLTALFTNENHNLNLSIIFITQLY